MASDDKKEKVGKVKQPRLPRAVRFPPLDEETILRWADDHYARTGQWPRVLSGEVIGGYGDTWSALDQCLFRGLRGLPGGASIAKLLKTHRPGPRPSKRPPVDIDLILKWADAHFARTGSWPTYESGDVVDATKETWRAINRALHYGQRGLPEGYNLARVLFEHRGVRNRLNPQEITCEQILEWADSYYARTGEWPKSESGVVEEMPELTWELVDCSLVQGSRGLEKGLSLPRLLNQERGVRNRLALTPLTHDLILEWADNYRERNGRWPNINSGDIPESPGDTWRLIDNALYQGNRRLEAGSSVARLLAERRGMRNTIALPPLTVEQILGWADAHYDREHKWPSGTSGPIPEAPGETWISVDNALNRGRRGLPGGSSVALLLEQERNRRMRQQKSELTIEQILAWADAHHAATGKWPTIRAGRVTGADGETWNSINSALDHGLRGLPSGESLVRMLARLRGKRNKYDLSPLSEGTILEWAKQHLERTGKWPTQKSGPVEGHPGETWGAINDSLWRGVRELPGWSSLPLLLDTIRKPTE